MNNLKKITEGIKDFLYDATDYILIFVIIIVISGVIAWRLDILFASEVEKTSDNITQNLADDSSEFNSSENHDSEDDVQVVLDDNENETNDDSNQSTVDNDESVINDQTQENSSTSDSQLHSEESSRIITVEIPDGTIAPGIADILLNKGLINNKSEFLKRAQELKLDTKLKSGVYKIKENSPLDTIIKTIARVK